MHTFKTLTQQIESQALAHFYDGRIDEGIRVLQSKLDSENGGDLAEVDRVRLMAVMGKMMAHKAFLMSSDCKEAIDVLTTAADRARDLGLEQVLSLALRYRGFAIYTDTFHNGVGQYTDAMPDIERSIQISEVIEDHCGLAQSLVYHGILLERTEQPLNAKAQYERATEISRKNGCTLEESYAVRHLAFIRQNEGNLKGALDYFKRSLELREKCGFRIGLALAYFAVGNVLVEKKRFADANKYIDQAQNLAEEFGLTRVITLCHYMRGESQAAQGNTSNAIAELERSRDLAQEIGYEIGVQRAEGRIAELTQS